MNQVYIYFCASIKYNYVLKMVAFNIWKRRNPLIAATHSFLVKVKFYHKMLETNACVFCDDNVIIFIFLKKFSYYNRIMCYQVMPFDNIFQHYSANMILLVTALRWEIHIILSNYAACHRRPNFWCLYIPCNINNQSTHFYLKLFKIQSSHQSIDGLSANLNGITISVNRLIIMPYMCNEILDVMICRSREKTDS